jgi:hypothetical protein
LLQATDDFLGNIKLITDTMLGRIQFRDGLWRIYAGAWASPTHILDRTAFVGPVTIQASAPRDQRYNGVRAFFVNPAKNWQRVECYPRQNSTYKTADGAEQIQKMIEVPGVTDEYRAQYISEILLRQSRNQITVSGPVGPKFMKLGLWETVTMDWPDMGWTSKTFRVVAYSINPDGRVDIGLQEEQSGDWNDLATGEYNNPSTSTMPATNPTNPSEPLNFSAEALMNGTVKFNWDRPIIMPDQSRYQLIRSINSRDASVGSVIWEGAANRVALEVPHPAAWYYVRARTNSYVGPYQPNTFGLMVAPFASAADFMRLNIDPEFTLSTSLNDIWKGPATWGGSSLSWITSDGGLTGGVLHWRCTSHSGVSPIEVPTIYCPSPSSLQSIPWSFNQRYRAHVRFRITEAFSIVGNTSPALLAYLSPWTGVGSPNTYAGGASNVGAQYGATWGAAVFSMGSPLNSWMEALMDCQFPPPNSGWGNANPSTWPMVLLAIQPPYAVGGNWKTGALEIDHVSILV